MKKLFAAILVLVLLLSSAAAADEIRFLDLPWLSSVESTRPSRRWASLTSWENASPLPTSRRMSSSV